MAPGIAGPAGAAVPPRTLRMSPRRVNSVFFGCSGGRAGSLTPPGFSPALAPGLGGNWMNPTLSPTLGPGGGGGGGGGSSRAGSGLDSGCNFADDGGAGPARGVCATGAGASAAGAAGSTGAVAAAAVASCFWIGFDLGLAAEPQGRRSPGPRGWGAAGGGGAGRRGRSGEFGMLQEDLLFEVFGSNLIQRTGGDPRGGNAQFFRLGQNLFVLQAELL